MSKRRYVCMWDRRQNWCVSYFRSHKKRELQDQREKRSRMLHLRKEKVSVFNCWHVKGLKGPCQMFQHIILWMHLYSSSIVGRCIIVHVNLPSSSHSVLLPLLSEYKPPSDDELDPMDPAAYSDAPKWEVVVISGVGRSTCTNGLCSWSWHSGGFLFLLFCKEGSGQQD